MGRSDLLGRAGGSCGHHTPTAPLGGGGSPDMVQVPVLMLGCRSVPVSVLLQGLGLLLVAGGQAQVEIAQVGWGFSALQGPAQASTCKPCRAAVRSVGELQYGIPHSQNQPRLELLRSRDCCTSHCLPLMSPFVCVLLAPPAQVPLPPDTRCCYCHTCTTHRPSYLPLQSVSPGAKVFILLPAILPSQPTRAASPHPVSLLLCPRVLPHCCSFPCSFWPTPGVQMNPRDLLLPPAPANAVWQLSANPAAPAGVVTSPWHPDLAGQEERAVLGQEGKSRGSSPARSCLPLSHFCRAPFFMLV